MMTGTEVGPSGRSTARSKGRKSSAGPSLSAVVSLPALLPGLAQADPVAVSDVCRSLSILSGHFAQLGAQSLSSSLERGGTLGTVPAEAAMTRESSIDRELDELLTGPTRAGDTGTASPSGDTGDGSIPAPRVAQSQEVGRAGVASAGRAARSARQSPLTSQSCIERGPGHCVSDGTYCGATALSNFICVIHLCTLFMYECKCAFTFYIRLLQVTRSPVCLRWPTLEQPSFSGRPGRSPPALSCRGWRS